MCSLKKKKHVLLKQQLQYIKFRVIKHFIIMIKLANINTPYRFC